MRHGNKINHLGRKFAHRKALLMNLSNALIQHKRINTTLAKAKELRKHIEPLINKTKVDSTHNRRILFSYLQDKQSIQELYNVIAQKVVDRPGGYTRIIKLGFRKGDAADMAMIELVDFNEIYGNTPKASTGKTRRSRSGKAAASAPVTNEDNSSDLVEDVTATEVEETPVLNESIEETLASDNAIEESVTEASAEVETTESSSEEEPTSTEEVK